MIVSHKICGVYAVAINSRNQVDTVVIGSEALVRRSKGKFDRLKGSSIPHGCIADVCRVTTKLMPYVKYGSAECFFVLVEEEFAS